jgi:hypothetical protein
LHLTEGSGKRSARSCRARSREPSGRSSVCPSGVGPHRRLRAEGRGGAACGSALLRREKSRGAAVPRLQLGLVKVGHHPRLPPPRAPALTLRGRAERAQPPPAWGIRGRRANPRLSSLRLRHSRSARGPGVARCGRRAAEPEGRGRAPGGRGAEVPRLAGRAATGTASTAAPLGASAAPR